MYIQREEQAQFICNIRVSVTIERLPPCSSHTTQKETSALNPCSYVNEVLKSLYWYFNTVHSKDEKLRCANFRHKELSSRQVPKFMLQG